jgi:hypothetical protein
MNTKPAPETPKLANSTGKTWTANWRIQKDKQSAVSKLSSNRESIETIWSQLAVQQEENKRLANINKTLKDNSTREAEPQEEKWKIHISNESAAWAERFEQEKALLQTATNQTIQNHKAMNAHLKQENELIKARCDSQEQQQKIMQQQIAELTKIQNQDMDSNMASEPPTDYDLQRDKQDTPTTPTEMSNSPIRTQKTQKTNIAPQNLLESLSKPAHHTPT